MAKKSAAQRSRKAERRAKRDAQDGQATTSATKASSGTGDDAPVDHSTEARSARLRKRKRSALWTARARAAAIAIAIGVPLVIGAAFISGFFEPQLGVAASNEGGVGRHVGQGRTLPQQNRPPSSGLHFPNSARYSVSPTPIDPGNWIHNLEHGGIVILYRCETQQECGDAASKVRSEVSSLAAPGRFSQVKIVGSPYQDMDTPFTAVAWRRTLPLESFDAEQLLAFYDRYVDRGPESAP
ncbi:MAG: DUF3105 domain-containing protein [Chloroflexota bacterium]